MARQTIVSGAPFPVFVNETRTGQDIVGGTYVNETISTTTDLTPSLFVNTNIFYGPTVHSTINLTPSLFINSNAFYTHVLAKSNSLTPSLFNNSNTFYAADITVGPVNISPNLFNNTNIFYAPHVSGPQLLAPALFVNVNTFYSQTVSYPLFGKIKFVKRGHAAAATILEDDLAAHEWGTDTPDQLTATRIDELELPHEIDVNYINIDADYQQGSQRSQRMTGASSSIETISCPIVLSDAKAKQVADVNIFNRYNGRTSYSLQLSNKWAKLEPTDVVDVVNNDITYTIRITKKDAGKPGLLKLEAVLEDSTVYTQIGLGVSTNIDAQTVDTPAYTYAQLMDIPLLRDQDDGAGFYAAMAGYNGSWGGAVLYKSTDSGATYAQLKTMTTASVMGAATTVLGDFDGGNVFDYVNTVDVFLLDGELSSSTELAVLNGANVMVIGDEIVQFITATLIATKKYTLSGLLRGRRGTEWAMSNHAVADRIALADIATWRRIDAPTSEIGLSRQYKPVSFGMTLQQTPLINFTNTAAGLECYSVADLTASVDGSNNATLDWKRRTRIGGEWRDYVDVPLSEETESYEIEIWDSAYNTLKRTITASTNTCSYTAAQQVTDFGIIRPIIYVRAYQLSAVVGRGYVNQQDTFLFTKYAELDSTKKASNITLSGGNLIATHNAAGNGSVLSDIGVSSGKYYWEVLVGAYSTGTIYLGIATVLADLTIVTGFDVYGWSYRGASSTGAKVHNGSAPAYGGNFVTNDIVSVLLDMDNDTLIFWINGVSQGTAFTGLSGTMYAAAGKNGNMTLTFNFGGSAFTYTPPAGYELGLHS